MAMRSEVIDVGAGLGATKEGKWLPISRKRHQIGHLDFGLPRLLTEMLEVRILPGEPKFFNLNKLQSLGRAFGS